MRNVKDDIEALAARYGLQFIYAFGSRAREALEFLDGRKRQLTSGVSDLDIGVKSSTGLAVSAVPRVDLVVLSEVSTFLALEIVSGELLFAQDLHYEAEYQLYIMRRAAEMMRFQRAKERMMLGIDS